MIPLTSNPSKLFDIIKDKPFPEISKAWMDMSKEWIDHCKKYNTIEEAIQHSDDSSWILFTFRQLGYSNLADHLWSIGIDYMQRIHKTNLHPNNNLGADSRKLFSMFIKDNY